MSLTKKMLSLTPQDGLDISFHFFPRNYESTFCYGY